MKKTNAVTIQVLHDECIKKLPDYISGSLPDNENWHIEELMNDDPAFADAIEGLKSIENTDELFSIHRNINALINTRFVKINRKKQISYLFFPHWIIISIVLLILILTAGYFVIYLLK